MADNRHTYNITTSTVVINNGSGDEKDRQIEQLKEEVKRLKTGWISSYVLDSRSNNTIESDDNNVCSVPSQPYANRFSDHRNNLSQDDDCPYMISDKDETESKHTINTTQSSAIRETLYEIDPEDIDCTTPGKYKNVSSMHTKNPRTAKVDTRNKRHLHDRANGSKTDEDVHNGRMNNGLRPFPIQIQRKSVGLRPPLPERNPTARIPTATNKSTTNGTNSEASTTNNDRSSDDDTLLNETRPQKRDDRNVPPYSKLVDTSYLETSNIKNDLEHNIEKDENRHGRSKIYTTKIYNV